MFKLCYNVDMNIYIEDFLFQNIIINFCLLRLVHITSKSKTSFFRISISTVIGSAFSVIAGIFLTNTIIMNLLKLLCASIMIIIAFQQTKKYLLINFILLFFYTYAIGGFITMLSSHQQYTPFGIITYTNINPYIIYFVVILLSYIFEWIARTIKLRLKTNSFIYEITLYHKGRKLSLNAYLDTGNLLNLDGKPVVIIDLDVYLKLSNISLIDYYLIDSPKISTHTINGTNHLKIFSIDEIVIKKNNKKIKFSNQLIAINNTKKFKNTNYQALLSPMLL